MKNNSSGWLIVALLAVIPAALIFAGLLIAIFSTARTSTRSVTYHSDDPISFRDSQNQVESDLKTGSRDSSANPIAAEESVPVSSAVSKQDHLANEAGKEKSSQEKSSQEKSGPPSGNDDKKLAGKTGPEETSTKPPAGTKPKQDSDVILIVSTKSFETPEWVTKDRGASDGKMFLVETDLESPENVNAAIDQKSVAAAEAYIRIRFGERCAKHVRLKPSYVKNRLVKKRHVRQLKQEEVNQLLNGNPVTQDLEYVYGYAELEFDPGFDAHVTRLWKQRKQSSRLSQILLGGGTLLVLLMLAFSFLSTDQVTRGMYTVRLQIGSLLLLVLVGVVVWAIANRLLWI